MFCCDASTWRFFGTLVRTHIRKTRVPPNQCTFAGQGGGWDVHECPGASFLCLPYATLREPVTKWNRKIIWSGTSRLKPPGPAADRSSRRERSLEVDPATRSSRSSCRHEPPFDHAPAGACNVTSNNVKWRGRLPLRAGFAQHGGMPPCPRCPRAHLIP